MCCFVFEMFLFLCGKGKSVFLFKLGIGNERWFQGIDSVESPIADMKGRGGGWEEKLSELSIRNMKVEVAPVLSEPQGGSPSRLHGHFP